MSAVLRSPAWVTSYVLLGLVILGALVVPLVALVARDRLTGPRAEALAALLLGPLAALPPLLAGWYVVGAASRIEAWLAALVVLPGPVVFGSCLSARIHGLITAFGGIAYVNASERAGLLDAGIRQSTLFPATTVGALVLLILLALPLFAVAVDAARRDAVVSPRVLLLCAVLAASGLGSLALVRAYRPWSGFDEAQSSTEKDQPSVDRRPARPSWG